MTPEALLDRLADEGIRIRPSDRPGLVVVSPAERLTLELRAEIEAHRAALLALLEARGRPPSKAWADQAPPPIERPPSDPRPELEGSLAWAHLLAFATPDRADPTGLYGTLHSARYGGAALKFKQGRWRIEPRLDPTELISIWHDQAAWDADRGRYLLPHRARLTKLLRLLPTPTRMSAPPPEVEAGVATLRQLGWTFNLKPDGGLTASSAARLPESDVAWCKAHVDQIVELLQGEGE